MMDFVKKLRDRYHYSLVVLKELVKPISNFGTKGHFLASDGPSYNR